MHRSGHSSEGIILEEEPIEHSASSGTPNEGNEPLNTDCPEDTEDGEAIIVGAVGSAAPWFLTGWTNEVEVEFMIDTGCQVTILATSVFRQNVYGPSASKIQNTSVYATAGVSRFVPVNSCGPD